MLDEKEVLQDEQEELEQDLEQENELQEQEELEQGTEQETQEEKPVQKEDHVPLSKFMAEKKRRKELESLLADQKDERERLQYKQKLIDNGYPEDDAERQASEESSRRRKMEQLEARQMDIDIRDLARGGDEFFADAETFKDDIKDLMRKKGYDAEEAYISLRGKTRRQELKVKQEQRALAARAKSPIKKVETAASIPQKAASKLSPAEMDTLKELQKAMPDANWTVEKYIQRMKTRE